MNAGKARPGVAGDVDRRVNVLERGPLPALSRERRKLAPDQDDRSRAAVSAGKGNDVVSVRAPDLQRLIFALREHIGEFVAQFEQMPRPGQLELAIRPGLDQPAPVRGFQ
ncbi:hypothetical protein ACVIU4_001796 [Bradyrhizobium barranii subsp. barranii]